MTGTSLNLYILYTARTPHEYKNKRSVFDSQGASFYFAQPEGGSFQGHFGAWPGLEINKEYFQLSSSANTKLLLNNIDHEARMHLPPSHRFWNVSCAQKHSKMRLLVAAFSQICGEVIDPTGSFTDSRGLKR